LRLSVNGLFDQMGFQSVGRMMASSSTVSYSHGTTNTLSSFAASNRSRRARQSDSVAFHPSQEWRDQAGRRSARSGPPVTTATSRSAGALVAPCDMRVYFGYSGEAQVGSSLVLRRLWSLGTRELRRRGAKRYGADRTLGRGPVVPARARNRGDALGADFNVHTHRR
jgi:hypothetical protein